MNGTLLWYYSICKREAWLMFHQITPDEQHDDIDYGRFLHEHSYQRNKKEILFGNVKFDVLLENEGKLIIGETKKSSKYHEASKLQLYYYLYTLRTAGINAEGMLLYPEEKKRVPVILDQAGETHLLKAIKEIEEITGRDVPPPPHKCNFCYRCGYREYCWS